LHPAIKTTDAIDTIARVIISLFVFIFFILSFERIFEIQW